MVRGLGAPIPLNPMLLSQPSSVTKEQLDQALQQTDPSVYDGNSAGASEPIEAPMPGPAEPSTVMPVQIPVITFNGLVVLTLIGVSVYALAKG